MMKRYLSLFLALILALSMIPAAMAESLVDESEHITIRVITQSHTLTKDLNEIPVWNELQKKHNLTIEWEQVSSGWSEKKAVILADPESMPDLWLCGLSDSDLIMNEGAFVDMTELIDQYAPNIKKMFEEEPATKGVSLINGAIYSLPQRRGHMPESYTVMMINQTWLDNLGLEMPTTLDELEQVLIAFRDGDPNGNGLKDEIPLDWNAGRGSDFPITALCGAWGYVEDYSDDMVIVEDGKVDFLWAHESYKNLQMYLNRLWNQNLINVEVFTQDYSGMMAKSRQGEAAMVGVTLGWCISDRTGQYMDQYVVLDALKASADSETPLWPINPDRLAVENNKASISVYSKYPERIIALLDDLYTEYYAIQMYYGSIPEFVEYDAVKDVYTIKEPAEGETLDTVKWTNALVNNAPMYFSRALVEKTLVPSEISGRLIEDSVYADNFPADYYPVVKFDADTIEELTFMKTDMYKLVDEKMASWVVNGGVEEEWDSYIQQLENMGLNEMRQIYQDAYDAFKAN